MKPVARKRDKVGIIVIHGIGEQKPTFADGFIGAVRKRVEISQFGRPPYQIAWKPVHWADIIPRDNDESSYLYPKTGEFFDNWALDLMAYMMKENYIKVHERVTSARAQLRKAGCTKLVVMGHSLGGIVAINHIHDNNLEPDLLITFGSPIRQFLVKVGKPPSIKAKAWANFYHPTEKVGKRVGGIEPSYFVEDISFITSFTSPTHILPFAAHGSYWNSPRFINEIANRLKEVIWL